jgi:type II secretory pathway pseudopilin PulG
MAALLVGLTIMAVLMSAAMPVWSQHMKREREEELIWRGNQYARAVGLFQRKYANAFPPTIDILVEQRFLRRKYKDPMTDDDFQPIPAGGGTPGQVGTPGQGLQPRTGGGSGAMPPQGFAPQPQPGGGSDGGVFGGQARTGQPSIGIQGVVSKSKETSIKIYNGRTRYNEWAFVYLATAQRITPGGPTPGMPGAQPGMTGPGGRPGFGPPGTQNRPPVPFGVEGTTFQRLGSSPFGPNSPFGQPAGAGDARQPGAPPRRPPGG